MIEFIQRVYQSVDQLNLSVTAVLLIALACFIAFLFAVRELAAWFLKVDDLKRDLRILIETTKQVEGEIKALQQKLSTTPVNPELALLGEEPPQKSGSSHSFPLEH